MTISFWKLSKKGKGKGKSNSKRRRWVALGFVFEGEDVAGLAVERGADGFEGGEADGPGFAGFQDGEVGQRDVDCLGEFGEGHVAAVEDFVEFDGDGHGLDGSFEVVAHGGAGGEDAAEDEDHEDG